MRKLVVHMSTGYCGEDWWDILAVSRDAQDYEIDQLAWQMTLEHGFSYGHEDDEAQDMFEYAWFDYVPEDHDMYRGGGGSFEEDF